MLARSVVQGAMAAAVVATVGAQGRPTITTLSTAAHLITGGDVLGKVAFGRPVSGLKVSVAGRDVTDAFRPARETGAFMGVVGGLANGRSLLEAAAGGSHATLELTSYPVTGPVVSGPWQQPFVCQTTEFALPDGSKLGPPLDADCSVKTIVQHVYRSIDDPKTFRPLPPGGALPADGAYHPTGNPRGARPTIFDAARNVYGVNPATGFALRPFDNVGVQYGFNALKAGAITLAQFLDLNERIGGVDHDSNYVGQRTVGDGDAIRRAYQAGLTLGGGGGLSSIPIFDNATSTETGGYHYGWFHFALRERLRQANGDADNLVMWRTVNAADADRLFDEWMAAYKSDTSADPQRVKVVRARPRAGVEGCYDRATPPSFVAEPLVFSRKPVSKCSALYPVYSNVRHEAGGPLAANILKCQLKPLDPRDYPGPVSAADLARLKTVFPGGVCDWSKPGVNQVAVTTWGSFGPSPKNLIAATTRP